MRDLWYLLLTAVTFAALLAYVRGCDTLGRRVANDGEEI